MDWFYLAATMSYFPSHETVDLVVKKTVQNPQQPFLKLVILIMKTEPGLLCCLWQIISRDSTFTIFYILDK